MFSDYSCDCGFGRIVSCKVGVKLGKIETLSLVPYFCGFGLATDVAAGGMNNNSIVTHVCIIKLQKDKNTKHK